MRVGVMPGVLGAHLALLDEAILHHVPFVSGFQ